MRGAAAAIIIASLLLSITTASAFIITVLGRYHGFEVFNDLLSRTRLAGEINHRRTTTVLAPTNVRAGVIAGIPEDVQRRILSDHVILDYYDRIKLNKLKDNRTVLTKLYQASGDAQGQQGFLVVVHRQDGSIVFGSAVRGSQLDSRFEGSVAAQPYNISVLSVSQPIVAPGIDGEWKPTPPEEAPAPPKRASPPPAETPEEDPKDAAADANDESAARTKSRCPAYHLAS